MVLYNQPLVSYISTNKENHKKDKNIINTMMNRFTCVLSVLVWTLCFLVRTSRNPSQAFTTTTTTTTTAPTTTTTTSMKKSAFLGATWLSLQQHGQPQPPPLQQYNLSPSRPVPPQHHSLGWRLWATQEDRPRTFSVALNAVPFNSTATTEFATAQKDEYYPSTTMTDTTPSSSGSSSRKSDNTATSSSTTTSLKLSASDYYQRTNEEQSRNSAKTVLYVNAASIACLVGTALYQLFHADIEALVALWQYDLGALDVPGLTKAAVAMELLARLPLDWIHSYEALVPTHPVFYKACTTGVAYGLGDLLSQWFQGKRLETLDLPRSLRSGTAGFIGHGPLCHYWLLFMETYLDFDGAWWATGIKVTADLTVWSIFLNAAYSFLIGTLAFRPPKDVWQDVQVTLWPALRSAWRFWPFVHTESFSHAVPLDLKLLWVDVMEIVWVTILSKVANEDKNAARLEQQQVTTIASTTTTTTTTAATTELKLEYQVAAEQEKENDKGNKDAAAAAATKTMTPNHLHNTVNLPKEEQRLQQVWAACWPLVAMWPVLYAVYQVEKFLGLEV